MKKTITLISALALFTAPLTFADDQTVEKISSDYIAGFLAGAELTDGAIITNISAGNESEFIQRAYRTRLGKEHPSAQSTYLAGFCLPENLSEDAIINNILKQIKEANSAADTGRDTVVYNAIKSIYPCKE